MKTIKRTTLILFVLFSCIGCDQVTKQMARQSLAGSETISLLRGALRLHYAENPGAFLSLGADIPAQWRFWIFTFLVGGVLAALLVTLFRSKTTDRPTTAALALVLGGGIGNLIDRILRDGRVTDFLNLGIGPVRTGVFNVADIAITCGSLWLVVLFLRHRDGRRAML